MEDVQNNRSTKELGKLGQIPKQCVPGTGQYLFTSYRVTLDTIHCLLAQNENYPKKYIFAKHIPYYTNYASRNKSSAGLESKQTL